jgi:peptide/nickel transport system permease protein
VDLIIAVTSTLLAIAIGVPAGVAAGYRSGIVPEVSSRLFDVVQAFPLFVLAIFLVGIFGPSTQNLIFVLAFVNTPIYFRLMRSEAKRLSKRTFVDAARVAGCSDLAIMYKHILPNSLVPLAAQMSVTIAWSVLLTAGISFLGAGVRAPTPEWGVMISAGAPQITSGQWWTSVFPGLTLFVTIIGFSLLANGISNLADPRRRQS